jgi:hypothetical protein
MEIRPYLIVPKLIPQPTWGGDYIAKYKGISDPKISMMKIGQAYELSSDTMLSTVSDSRDLPIEVGDPKTGETIEVIGDVSSMFPLQKLIDQDPEGVLGRKYLDQFGAKMQILIKFTQAKGNSFQVHVKPGKEIGHWKSKPESWYFFEKGRATLGLKPNADLSMYKKVCFEIEAFMKDQSVKIQNKTVTIQQAKAAVRDFLMTHSPFLYVNVVDVPKGAVIDLSGGGIHHSWEEGDDIPEGNIVYEVQVNVMDNDCTLRSFDKGKIGEDGSIRPIHIDDYFTALDADPAKNDPKDLIGQKTGQNIFLTPYYSTRENSDTGMLETYLGTDGESFVHRFALKEETMSGELHCGQGASVFFPASQK